MQNSATMGEILDRLTRRLWQVVPISLVFFLSGSPTSSDDEIWYVNRSDYRTI